jgi:hypothetical protein
MSPVRILELRQSIRIEVCRYFAQFHYENAGIIIRVGSRRFMLYAVIHTSSKGGRVPVSETIPTVRCVVSEFIYYKVIERLCFRNRNYSTSGMLR